MKPSDTLLLKNYLNLLLKACALRLLITILERSSRNEVRSYSTQCLTNQSATSVSVRTTDLSLGNLKYYSVLKVGGVGGVGGVAGDEWISIFVFKFKKLILFWL